MTITVLKPGSLTTIQSRPRNGMRHFGVPASGAADPLSLALANRLLENDWDACALEVTLFGPTLRFDAECVFAMVGAAMTATLAGRPISPHETVVARAGDVLAIGAAELGARSYLAVAGGLIAECVLGSASTYLPAELGGLKGRALAAGDRIAFLPATSAALQTPAEYRPPMSSSRALRASVSQEFRQLQRTSRERLFDTNWRVDARADRMGIKLTGPALNVSSDGHMPSSAVFPGTVQCPEGGSPYILSVDAGTVGGYPRVAQIARVDRHLLGQLRPGDHVQLLRRDPDEATAELRAMLDFWREWLPDIDLAAC